MGLLEMSRNLMGLSDSIDGRWVSLLPWRESDSIFLNLVRMLMSGMRSRMFLGRWGVT